MIAWCMTRWTAGPLGVAFKHDCRCDRWFSLATWSERDFWRARMAARPVREVTHFELEWAHSLHEAQGCIGDDDLQQERE